MAAGRKKLFKTYLSEHITILKRESDGVPLIEFKDLTPESIPTYQDVGKIVLPAESVYKQDFKDYYKIIGFEILQNGNEIYHVIGIERNYRSFYKQCLIIMPDNMVDTAKFEKHEDQRKQYKIKRKKG